VSEAPLDERIKELETELRELRRQQLRHRMTVPGEDTVPLVSFSVDNHLMAVYLPAVLEVIRMVELSPLPGTGPAVAGLLNLRSLIVPVVDLRRVLGLPPRIWGLDTHIIITEYEQHRLGLIVDTVLDVVSAQRGALLEPDRAMPWVHHLLFVTRSNDDRPLLVLDHSCLLSAEDEAAVAC
jgi:chemotaxis signal transduction protein